MISLSVCFRYRIWCVFIGDDKNGKINSPHYRRVHYYSHYLQVISLCRWLIFRPRSKPVNCRARLFRESAMVEVVEAYSVLWLEDLRILTRDIWVRNPSRSIGSLRCDPIELFGLRWSANASLDAARSANKLLHWNWDDELLYSFFSIHGVDRSYSFIHTNRSIIFLLDCRLSKRSFSVRWWRLMLKVRMSDISTKSTPKLKPVQRHFWKPSSSKIRPHRKHVWKNIFSSQSIGLNHFVW